MADSTWNPTEAVAWTEHDGPGRPPAGPPQPLMAATGLALAATFTGVLMTDTLCPEHRAWVQALASGSIVAIVAGLVLLSRRSAAAPALVLVASLGGVAMGAIDTVHAPGRGLAVAAGFAAVALLAAAATWFAARSVLWSRAAVRAMSGTTPPAASAPTGTETARPDQSAAVQAAGQAPATAGSSPR